jgi:hypothetical protein
MVVKVPVLARLESVDVTVYGVAILGLVVVWQYYQMQILAGRVLAVHLFDRTPGFACMST